jgi:hypothetical protein
MPYDNLSSEMDEQTERRTDGHGETSISPYNFVAGGIMTQPVKVKDSHFKNFISCLLVKRGGSLSFLTIFTFAIRDLLDLQFRCRGYNYKK